MPRFRRRFPRRGTSRPIRNREWTSFTTSLTNNYDEPDTAYLAPNAIARSWILDPGMVADIWDEPTIVRMNLTMQAWVAGPNSVIVGDYNYTVRGGFITWKHAVIDPPGSTTLDGIDPGDSSLDWLWWIEMHFRHRNTGTADFNGTQFWDFSGGSGIVPVKSKRKLELGYGLVAAFHCVPWSYPNAPGGVALHSAGRILLLNH